jgi:hypothetical protein
MRQRFIFFLVVLLLIFSGEIYGQEKPGLFADPQLNSRFSSIGYLVSPRREVNPPVFQFRAGIGLDMGEKKYLSSRPARQVSPFSSSASLVNSPVSFRLPVSMLAKTEKSLISFSPLYYCNHLGFFCQKELQIQKITSLPLFFRLGSMDYVNYMEQKPNAVKPGFWNPAKKSLNF